MKEYYWFQYVSFEYLDTGYKLYMIYNSYWGTGLTQKIEEIEQ